MTKYIIDEELREILNDILHRLQKHTDKMYWKKTDKYSDVLLLQGGKTIPLPPLRNIQQRLIDAEEVIEEKEYNAKTEEFILIAKELGLL